MKRALRRSTSSACIASRETIGGKRGFQESPLGAFRESAAAEEWRPVPGLEGRYDASSMGHVRNAATGRRVGTPDKDGYIRIGFQFDGRTATVRAHQMVAAAFLGQCPADHEIDHKNRVRWDNRVENLRFLPKAENQADRLPMGDRARFKAEADAVAPWTRKACGRCRGMGHNARTCAAVAP